MAYSTEVLQELRRYIGDQDSPQTYDDAQLTEYLDNNNGIPTTAAHAIWLDKAATAADLVDISEAGSSRKNSQLYQQAMEQARRFEPSSASTRRAPISRPIERA